ncbi:hypothetical protein FB107DRAFT_280687 [Schizophyllum commune]
MRSASYTSRRSLILRFISFVSVSLPSTSFDKFWARASGSEHGFCIGPPASCPSLYFKRNFAHFLKRRVLTPKLMIGLSLALSRTTPTR